MKKPVLFAIAALFTVCADAADFTWLKPGARANSIGSAFSSIANDPYTLFYNPAGLMNLTTLEMRSGVTRRIHTNSPGGDLSVAYARPLPDNRRITGLGYYGLRQNGLAKMDTITAGIGNSFTYKYLQKKAFYGGSFKIISLREKDKSSFGIGFDGGLLLTANNGLKTALTLTDLNLGISHSMTTLTIGNSYRRGDTLFAVDLKMRGKYSELFYGLEHNLLNSLLQFRAGKGIALNGQDNLVLGIGLNTTPWIIDFSASIPWRGFQENSAYCEMNVGYRFNTPTFTEKFIGDSVAKAASLKNQIDELKVQKTALETNMAAQRADKGIMETDLVMMQSRMKAMNETMKELELQIIETEHRKERTKPIKHIAPVPVPEKWPKSHKVAAGDTLRNIASRYYGNPGLWERIYEANEKNIARGLPVEGAVFTIPAPPPPLY